MHTVYRSQLSRGHHDVPIKTLTEALVLRLMNLKPEAWAMAMVSYPAVAGIYGIESWEGRPFLVVGLLTGGTLKDRLRQGPMPPSQAVRTLANKWIILWSLAA